MTPIHPPTASRFKRSLVLLPAFAAAALLIGGCGPGDKSEQEVAEAPTEIPASFPEPHQGPPVVEGANSKGVLEVLNPEVPGRPLYKEFGNVPYGTDIFWSTSMENTGPEPVIIRKAQAACGCTRFMDFTVTDAKGNAPDRPTPFTASEDRPLASIPAGGRIQMRMKLLTAYTKPNMRKLAMMRLYTNSQLEPYMTFEVGFQPTRAFVFAPESANLTNSPVSSGKSKRIKILVDRAGDPERVLDVVSTPDGIEAELLTETFAGEYIWYVNVSVPPLSPLGPIRGNVVLSTTDEDGNGDAGRLELPVVALVVPDVVASPSLVSFRAFDRSIGAEFTGRLAALVPGARLKILGARFDGDDSEKLSVEYTPVKAFDDGRAIEWTYTVRLAPGYPAGYVAGSLVFELEEGVGGLPDGQPINEIHVTLSGVARDAPASNN